MTGPSDADPSMPEGSEAERSPIRFHRVAGGGELVATAEVEIFERPTVVLRGWAIYRRGSEIHVVPPHRVFSDPVTGERKVWYFLNFEDAAYEEVWKARIKNEFVRWEKA
ncbi:MAG: hypothetical protein KC466_10950 [Myxococcales bacterium]|nr:hypothetical protein [Myxococcales bacterium]